MAGKRPLRFADEYVRHKMLDLIGDLPCRRRIEGHVVAERAGHAMHTALVSRCSKIARPGNGPRAVAAEPVDGGGHCAGDLLAARPLSAPDSTALWFRPPPIFRRRRNRRATAQVTRQAHPFFQSRPEPPAI